MSNLIDISGQTFGRWSVLELSKRSSKGAYWLCRCECGINRVVRARSLRRGISRSCGCLNRDLALTRIGQKSPGWRGGKTKSSSDYILIQAPNNPAAQKTGYVPEHRLVMETILGRTLYPEETVHHINGIRSDNRQGNLELWTSRQPRGQRVCDLVSWAKEIMRLYGDGE
jgi:hypothetical protein